MSIAKTFSHLSKDLLTETSSAFNLHVTKSSKKEKFGEAVSEKATLKGINQLLGALEKDTCKVILEKYGEKVEHNSKIKMQQSIQNAIKDKGMDSVFKNQSLETLKKCIKGLSSKPKATKQSELAEELEDHIQIAGLREMLEQMKKPFITEVLEELKLKKTGNKESGIERIVANAFPDLVTVEEKEEEKEEKKEEKKEKKEKKSTEKKEKEQKERPPVPPLKKGITYDQIFQSYYASELKDYCKKEKLLSHGNKQEMIKRILAYLGGDVTTTKPGNKTSKKRKASQKAPKSDAKKVKK
eukprot:gene4264-7600_t